jgi:hypothetical protein
VIRDKMQNQFVEIDEPLPEGKLRFEEAATIIQRSVIAIAFGLKKDGLPNIVGTGFGVDDQDGAISTEFFATCWHVAEEELTTRDYTERELSRNGLIDNIPRIALRTKKGDSFEWKWYKLTEMPIRHTYWNYEDICIYQFDGISKIPGAQVPPLVLSSDAESKSILGSEVGICGFPTSGNLQDISLQPFLIKTIISGTPLYKFKRLVKENGRDSLKDVISPRYALGCSIAAGFSGSPMFSIRDDGLVLGMMDWMPVEEDEWESKFTVKEIKSENISVGKSPSKCLEGSIRGHYPMGFSFAIPTMRILPVLKGHPKFRK